MKPIKSSGFRDIEVSSNPGQKTRLTLINNKKENLPSWGLCCFSGLQGRNKRKIKVVQILGPYQETEKKTMGHVVGTLDMVSKILEKGTVEESKPSRLQRY